MVWLSWWVSMRRLAHRARQISIEADTFHIPLEKKPVTMAIEEVAEGKLTASVKEEYMK